MLLLLIDGYALSRVAFHGMPPIANQRGERVQTVMGFFNMLATRVRELGPTHLATCWDVASDTSFRNDLFSRYKGKRKPVPEAFPPQVALLRWLLAGAGVPDFEVPGYEADDLLATLACRASAEGLPAVVLTGDADMLQLAGGTVRVYYWRGRFQNARLYDQALFEAEYGLPPRLWPAMKAFTGDSSDNYPRVRGLKDAEATELLCRYGSLEALLAAANHLPEKQRVALSAGGDQLRLNCRLSQLVVDVPLGWNAAAAAWPPATAGNAAFAEAGVAKQWGNLLAASSQLRLAEMPQADGGHSPARA
ncbi:MAG: 5'-3' exonuclease [Chloroflexota bacterium]